MTPRTSPALTVPVTVQSTAVLTDWLVRTLVPTALEAAGLGAPANQVRALPAVTARHLKRPRRLRRHELRLRAAIDLAEAQLWLRGPGRALEPGRGLPVADEIYNMSAATSEVVADMGSPAAALANRLLLLSIALAGADPSIEIDDLSERTRDAYCSLLDRLWRIEPEVEVVMPHPGQQGGRQR